MARNEITAREAEAMTAGIEGWLEEQVRDLESGLLNHIRNAKLPLPNTELQTVEDAQQYAAPLIAVLRHVLIPRLARAPPPRAVYSIAQFCEAHGISQAMYFKMRSAGRGPTEMRVGTRRLISLEAAAEWRRTREAAPADAGVVR